MKRVAIIQARMTSTRLPGKVLADLAGKPMLERQLERVARCKNLDQICVAVTTNKEDDPIVDLVQRLGYETFRGSELDVLSRYAGAAIATRAELVVRITSDCPLIDPEVSDRVIAEAYTPDANCDYASNTIRRSYPRGLDTEAFFADTLFRAARFGTSKPAREHVTWFVHRERPDLFVRRDVFAEDDNSELRWTVDTPEDLQMVRAVYALMEETKSNGDKSPYEMPYPRLVQQVKARPDIVQLNAMIQQKTE